MINFPDDANKLDCCVDKSVYCNSTSCGGWVLEYATKTTPGFKYRHLIVPDGPSNVTLVLTGKGYCGRAYNKTPPRSEIE